MTIGILGAMQSEVDAALRYFGTGERESFGPHHFVRTEHAGHTVLIGESGIGKVNAALSAQALLHAGATMLLFTGVAGGVHPDLQPGDLVLSTHAVQHDVDVSALGYAPGEIPGTGTLFAADETLIQAAQHAAQEIGERAHLGVIASGDTFVASKEGVQRLQTVFGAACTEMEGAAVAQVAAKWNIPFLIVRALSDSADGEAATDFRAFTEFAAERSAKLVATLLNRLPINR